MTSAAAELPGTTATELFPTPPTPVWETADDTSWWPWVRRGIRIGAALVGLLVLAAPSCLGIIGWHTTQIDGPSMVPTYQIGDVLIERPGGSSDLRPGRIVTVRGVNGATETHRVVATTTTNGEVTATLQGDANSSADLGLVSGANVTGVPVIKIKSWFAIFIGLSANKSGRWIGLVVMVGALAWPVRRPRARHRAVINRRTAA